MPIACSCPSQGEGECYASAVWMHLFVCAGLCLSICILSRANAVCTVCQRDKEALSVSARVTHRSWSPLVCMAGRRRWWKSPTGRCKVSGCSPAAPTWTGWKCTHRRGRREINISEQVFLSIIIYYLHYWSPHLVKHDTFLYLLLYLLQNIRHLTKQVL